jgi:hypothetical protein
MGKADIDYSLYLVTGRELLPPGKVRGLLPVAFVPISRKHLRTRGRHVLARQPWTTIIAAADRRNELMSLGLLREPRGSLAGRSDGGAGS